MSVPAVMARLDRFWFAPSARYQLWLLRVALCLWLAFHYSDRVFPQLESYLGRSELFLDPPAVARWLRLPLAPGADALKGLRIAAYALLALAGLGLFTRPALALLAVVNLYLGFSANAWGYTSHSAMLPAVALVILAAAPGVERGSVDAYLAWRRSGEREPLSRALFGGAYSVWPVRLLLAYLCLVYFTSGLSKLRHAGPRWMDGQTLGFYLGGGSLLGPAEAQRFIADDRAGRDSEWRDGHGLVDFAYVGRPTGLAAGLRSSPLALRVLSISSVALEISFPLALASRNLCAAYLVSAALFHGGIRAALAIDFSSYILMYLAFIDFRRLARFRPKRAS